MKHTCLAVGMLLTAVASAQNYSIDWYKVAGGGGVSASGLYSMSGTIGQQDAGGPMVGGGHSLTGGFWSLFSIPTANAPTLNIFLTTTNTVVVYWPSSSGGWNLQQNLDLASKNWNAPAEVVNDNGINKFIIVSPPVNARFYRLSSL